MIIGTIGIGLFVLIITWILALVIFVVGVKYQNNISWIALGSAAALTAILILIPVEKANEDDLTDKEDIIEKDYTFVYQAIFLSFIALSAVAAFVAFFILHCIEPIRPKAILEFYSDQQ